MKPAALRNIPTLQLRDQEFMDAFRALDHSRRMGHSAPEPLQVSEVLALCQLQGIASPAHRSKYLRILQSMDSTSLEHWSKSQPQK